MDNCDPLKNRVEEGDTSRHTSESETDVDAGTLEGAIVELAVQGKLAGAAQGAIRESRALGLPVTFKRGNQIVKEYADGRVEVLETIAKLQYVLPPGVKIIERR